MEQEQQEFLSVWQIAQQFEKIYQGIDKTQVQVLEQELLKMYPSEKSQVWIFSDYGEDDNSIGLDIGISEALKNVDTPKTFAQLMQNYLIYTDLQKLTGLAECIKLMERKAGEKYEVDLIPVFYHDELKNHHIHLRIIKL